MINNLAADGKVWFCMACGKRAKDQYGEVGGWDESCMFNSVEMDASLSRPDAAACKAFSDERDRHIAGFGARIDGLIADWKNLKTDPKLLALAQACIKRIDADKAAA